MTFVIQFLTRCNWADLVNCSHCNRHFRRLVQKILEQRIRMLVIQFVSEEFLPHFWTVMGSSKSCIMGGTVACIMMASQYPGFHLDVAPMQLDIVVPVDVSHPSPAARWKRLLL